MLLFSVLASGSDKKIIWSAFFRDCGTFSGFSEDQILAEKKLELKSYIIRGDANSEKKRFYLFTGSQLYLGRQPGRLKADEYRKNWGERDDSFLASLPSICLYIFISRTRS